jgi:PAS domain S-box-containing protein
MPDNDQPGDGAKKQVEELLASPELARAVENDEFKQFLDHVPVAILVSRVRGEHARIVYCNASYQTFTDTSCDEVLGAGWSVLDEFEEEDKPHRKLGAAAREEEDFLGVFRREAAEGGTTLVEAYAGVIQNPDGSENYRIVALVDVSDRDRRQREQLRQEVRDKDMLLRELQHRVKNNLQLVIALIRIEARQVREGGSVDLESLARRVEALSLLYRALSMEAADKEIDLGHYLSEIGSAVMRSHGTEGIRLEMNVENCPISVNVAMPAGLVVNELITNSFKHAFADGREGTIAVRCLRAGEHYQVTVEDNGVGLPVGASWPARGKISDLMVRSLQENSGASLRVDSQPGRGVTVSFTVKAPG